MDMRGVRSPDVGRWSREFQNMQNIIHFLWEGVAKAGRVHIAWISKNIGTTKKA